MSFQKVKERMRGVVVNFFNTKFGEAVAVKLTEVPTCEVWRTEEGQEEKLAPAVGDIVNIGLNNIDLKRKITHKLHGYEVGVWLDGHLETENGTMKVYGVKVFEMDQEGGLPF